MKTVFSSSSTFQRFNHLWLMLISFLAHGVLSQSIVSPDFSFQPKDRIALVGDTLLEREQTWGYLETAITARHPAHDLVFRNFAWSGDNPLGQSRASFDWSKPKEQWVQRIARELEAFEPTVLLLGYGMASSLEHPNQTRAFRDELVALIEACRAVSKKPADLRVVLLSPMRHEAMGAPLPDPSDHNQALVRYVRTLRALALEQQLPFVDLYHDLGDGHADPFKRAFTENGIHPGPYGYARIAELISRVLSHEPWPWRLEINDSGVLKAASKGLQVWDFQSQAEGMAVTLKDDLLPAANADPKDALLPTSQAPRIIQVSGLPPGRYALKMDGQIYAVYSADQWAQGQVLERGPQFDQATALRHAVIEKNETFFHRYRPQNETYLFGFRKHEQGQNAVEIPQFDPLVAEQEKEIHALAKARKHRYEWVKVAKDLSPSQALAWRLPQPAAVETRSLDAAQRDRDPSAPTDRFQLAPEVEMTLWAETPLISKPIQINFDPEGRLWIAGSRLYPQIQPGQAAEDQILVMEDTDRDGVADHTTVFADGLLMPTGIEPGDGGAYVGQSTELLHLKDTDGDGRADQRRIVLSGFGTEDTHHILHTLRWGHDGQLYMNQSIYIHSHLETPHGLVRLNSGGVLHLRPDNLELDVYLRGFCNPWGHQFDLYGQSFVTDGAGFQGISYGVPGAMYFTYAGGRRLLDSISPGSYPKFCGLELVQSAHWPEDWQGSAITCDFRAHRIVRFEMTEQDAGYAAREAGDLVRSLDPTFRPIDVKIGPDGALYIADWSNPIIQHGEVDFRDARRDKVTGRIWRVTYKGRAALPLMDLRAMSHTELLDQLLTGHGERQKQVRRVLTERGAVIGRDLEAWRMAHPQTPAQLQALWMYQSLNQVEPTLLRSLLEDEDGRVRAAAVRVLSFWQASLPDGAALLAARVKDAHPRVRLEAIRALAKVGTGWAAATALQVLEQPMDRFLDYALWLTMNDLAAPWVDAVASGAWKVSEENRAALEFGLTAIPGNQAAQILEPMTASLHPNALAEGPWMQLIAKAGTRPQLNRLMRIAADPSTSESVVLASLRALREAARLRNLQPDQGQNASNTLLGHSSQAVQEAAIQLVRQWKRKEAMPALASIAGHVSTQRATREQAVAAIAALGGAPAWEALQSLSQNPEAAILQGNIVRSMALLRPKQALPKVWELMNGLEEEAALEQLWTSLLQQKPVFEAIQSGITQVKLNRSAAQAGMRSVQKMGRHEPELMLALEKAGGLSDTGSETLGSESMKQWAAQAEAQGDPYRGEQIYRRPELGCIACHAIGGVGGQVGPDLTSIGASAPTDYLVESLLMPNAKIKEGYHSVIVETRDEAEYSGILQSENDQELFLRNAINQVVSIPKKDVTRRIMGTSLMPSGLIDALSVEERQDLIHFLSRLGESGPFDAARNDVARRWKLRAGRHTDEQFGIDRIIGDVAGPAWKPADTMVDGRLPQSAMAQALQIRNINQVTSLIGLMAAARFESTGNTLQLDCSAPSDARLWIDGREMTYDPKLQLTLPAGSHTLILQLNPKNLPESLRANIQGATFVSDL